MGSYIKGIKLNPPILPTNHDDRDEPTLSCKWCHNPCNNPIVPRAHLPTIFLDEYEVDCDYEVVDALKEMVHKLDSFSNLCLRCNRHYEIFAAPWPHRIYPKKAIQIAKTYTSVQEEEESEELTETSICNSPSADQSEASRPTPSLSNGASESNPSYISTPPDIDLNTIPREPYQSTEPGRDLIFIDPWDSLATFFWPAIIVPSHEIDPSTMIPIKDKKNYYIARRLDTIQYQIVDKRGAYKFNPDSTTFTTLMEKDPQFLDRPGIREALCYFETQCPPKGFMWCKWRTNYAADKWEEKISCSDINSLPNLVIRKRKPVLGYSEEREFIESKDKEDTIVSQKYQLKVNNTCMAIFPKEGFCKLEVKIKEVLWCNENRPICSWNSDLKGMRYLVNLKGTDTNRYISPNQIVVEELEAEEIDKVLKDKHVRVTRSRLAQITKKKRV